MLFILPCIFVLLWVAWMFIVQPDERKPYSSDPSPHTAIEHQPSQESQ